MEDNKTDVSNKESIEENTNETQKQNISENLLLEQNAYYKECKTHFDNTILKKIIYSDLFDKYLLPIIGNYYYILHYILMMLFVFMICFSTNKLYLFITVILLSCVGFANLCLHNCPLSMCEKKYLSRCATEERILFLQSVGLNMSPKLYESQLEAIINGWSLVAVKLLILMIKDSIFKCKSE